MPVASTRPPVARSSRRWVLVAAILLVALVVALARAVLVGCGDTAAPEAAPKLALDPPEPTPPEVECAFEPLVFCVAGHSSARCPASQGSLVDSVYPTEAQLSAAATRARRAADPTACCYVQYRAVACD